MSADPDYATGRSRTGLAKLRGSVPTAERTGEPAAAPVFAPGSAPATSSSAPPEFRDPPGPRPPRQPAGRRARSRLVALLVCVAVLVTLVLRWGDQLGGGSPTRGASASTGRADQADADARLAALQAARQFAVSFFTYDYRNVDGYFRRVEAASTGSFRADFVSKESTLKTVVAQLKTVATGQVPDTGAGIFALADGKAVAFVAANLNASNAVTKNGQKRYRVKLSMQLVKGAWLVTDFAEVI